MWPILWSFYGETVDKNHWTCHSHPTIVAPQEISPLKCRSHLVLQNDAGCIVWETWISHWFGCRLSYVIIIICFLLIIFQAYADDIRAVRISCYPPESIHFVPHPFCCGIFPGLVCWTCLLQMYWQYVVLRCMGILVKFSSSTRLAHAGTWEVATTQKISGVKCTSQLPEFWSILNPSTWP